MRDAPRVLLTGATGFLGSHLAAALLRNGSEHLVCLARPGAGRSARERVEAAIRRADGRLQASGVLTRALQERLEVVEGDLTTREWEEHPLLVQQPIESCWHLAAVVHLDDRAAAQVLATNLGGGRRLLDWLVRRRVPELNLVSTAYVAGAAVGVVLERPADPAVPVNNAYEASKRGLESELLRQIGDGSISGRIFRPTILLGHAVTGHPDPQLGGVYGFLARAQRLAERHRGDRGLIPLTVVADPRLTLSLLPVDQAVGMMTAVAAAATSLNGIYHIGPAEPTDVAWMLRIAGRYLGIAFGFTEDPATLDPLSRTLYRGTLPWQPYLTRCRHFATSRTRAYLPDWPRGAGIDAATMHRLMRVFAEAWEPRAARPAA